MILFRIIIPHCILAKYSRANINILSIDNLHHLKELKGYDIKLIKIPNHFNKYRAKLCFKNERKARLIFLKIESIFTWKVSLKMESRK